MCNVILAEISFLYAVLPCSVPDEHAIIFIRQHFASIASFLSTAFQNFMSISPRLASLFLRFGAIFLMTCIIIRGGRHLWERGKLIYIRPKSHPINNTINVIPVSGIDLWAYFLFLSAIVNPRRCASFSPPARYISLLFYVQTGILRRSSLTASASWLRRFLPGSQDTSSARTMISWCL